MRAVNIVNIVNNSTLKAYMRYYKKTQYKNSELQIKWSWKKRLIWIYGAIKLTRYVSWPGGARGRKTRF